MRGRLPNWDQLARQLSGRNFFSTSVRLVPWTVIWSGDRALPHTQATGTTGTYSTMAGRSVIVLQLMAAIAGNWFEHHLAHPRLTASAGSL